MRLNLHCRQSGAKHGFGLRARRLIALRRVEWLSRRLALVHIGQFVSMLRLLKRETHRREEEPPRKG
jgi:hypothetical protein